jgi:hypothetical protein
MFYRFACSIIPLRGIRSTCRAGACAACCSSRRDSFEMIERFKAQGVGCKESGKTFYRFACSIAPRWGVRSTCSKRANDLNESGEAGR